VGGEYTGVSGHETQGRGGGAAMEAPRACDGIPEVGGGDAWADEDAGADRQGGREMEALRDVESAHSLAGERGSPQAADAGGVCGCLAMAQAGLVSALQELGPPRRREKAAQSDGGQGLGTMAQLAPEPCVGRLGEPGQEGDGAEEDSESGFDEMEQARGEYGIQDVEGVVRHSEGCGDAGTEDHAALAEPDGISSFGTMEGCSS